MKRIVMLLLLFISIKGMGQTTGYFRYDTVRIYKQGGTAELYLINKTKDSLGLLTNIGGGLTTFLRSRVLNDSTLIVGLDTLRIRGGGSGGVPRISSTDQEIVRFSGTNGDIQGTPGVTANGSGNFSVPNFWTLTNAGGLQYAMLPLSHGFSTPATNTTNTPFDFVTGAQSQSGGNLEMFRIATLYNQTSTAGATDFTIKRTETAVGSGQHHFLRLYGGISGTTERFSIDRLGRVKVGQLDNGSSLDSVVVWDATTGLLKKVAQSDISGGGNNLTTIVRKPIIALEGDSAMGIPDSLDIIRGWGVILDGDSAITVDSATLSAYYLRLKDSTLYATQYDLTQIVSGINQLTGDGTAGPGTGSQALTISPNVITNAKLRQSAGLSVIGRYTSTSGNVADITAANDGESLLREGNELKFGKVNLSKANAITGNLPKARLNDGTDAEKNTFLSGEGIYGKWKDIGASTFFKVGDATFPAAGDSLYTNLSLSDYLDYDVYREGIRQYWDSIDGVQVIPSTGQFVFHPPLVANERVNIMSSRRTTLRTPPYPSFNINTIPSVFGWYDATDVTTITQVTGVSQWADKTPNANHLAQATGGSQPTYFNNGGSNNQAFVRFSSSRTISKTYSVADSGALTVYMVVKQAAHAAGVRIYSFRTQGGANGVISNTGGTTGTYWGYTEYDGTSQNAADLNTGWGDWQLVRFIFKGAGAETVFKNKLAGYTRTLHNLGAGNPSILGRAFATFGGTAFDMSEAIIVKGEVTTTNNTQIVNYLTSKYEIAQRSNILFFGDSHTMGLMSGTPTGDPYFILAAKEKGYDIMNQGVSGTVAHPINPYNGSTGSNLSDLYNLYDSYLAANQPYIIFQYGTNDGSSPVNATWVTNYKAYIQHFIDAGIPLSKIIICSPPYNSSATYATNLANTRPVVAQIATDLGIQFCDFYTYTQGLGLDCNSTYTGGDAIHGNSTIHRALADILKTFLQ